MKSCRRCSVMLPLDAYYTHSQMADGHLNICKKCTKARVRRHRAANLESIQEYDRARGLTPKRKARNREWARRNGHRRDGYVDRYSDSHPDRRSAHVTVGNAIRSGVLVREPCERCGTNLHIHAHHEDYSKPLDVTWLCRSCHGERHREINEDRRRNRSEQPDVQMEANR